MTRYRLLSAAAAVSVATLAVLAPAAPAQAHTTLSRTTPAAKSTVTAPVSAVTLTFTGLVRRSGTTVAVTGPDKISYRDADPQVRDKTITQRVRPLPVGVITVAWRAVAADCHPLQGSFTFTNRAAPPSPTTSPTEPTGPAPARSTTMVATATPEPVGAASDSGSSPAVWWAVAGGAALALALLGGLLWRRRSAD